MLGIYCRISREKEEGKDRSINDQKELGKEKAEELGLKYKFYIDEGISGAGESLDSRPGITALLEDVVNRIITTVFVVDESRLSRNPRTKYIITDLFKEYNVITHSYVDGIIDYSNPDDEFISEIKGVIHKRQITEQRIKIKSVLHRNAKDGKAHSSIFPYGYSKDDNNFLIVDEEEAQVVKRIYEMSLEGIGTRKISEILNTDGVPTRYNKLGEGTLSTKNKYTGEITTTQKKDIRWAGNTIRNIITNRLYFGERTFGGKLYEAPPIFEQSYWQKVNDNLTLNKNTTGKKTEYQYLLKGKIKCSICGRNYYGRKRKNDTDNYYMCSSYRYKDQRCGNRGINIDRFDKFIFDLFFVEGELKKLMDDVLNDNGTSEKIKAIQTEIKQVESTLLAFNRQREKVLDMAQNEIIDNEETKKRLEKIIKLKNEEQDKLEKHNQQLNYLLNGTQTQEALERDLRLESIWEGEIKVPHQIKERLEKAFHGKKPFKIKRELISKYINLIQVEYKEDIYHIKISFKLPIPEQNYISNRALSHAIDTDSKKVIPIKPQKGKHSKRYAIRDLQNKVGVLYRDS